MTELTKLILKTRDDLQAHIDELWCMEMECLRNGDRDGKKLNSDIRFGYTMAIECIDDIIESEQFKKEVDE